MTDRIDHAAEAAGRLRAVASAVEEMGDQQVAQDVLAMWNANASRELQAAQVHATLALAEQERVANLMRASARPFSSGEALTALRVNIGDAAAPTYRFRPEVAAALGLPWGDEDLVDAEVHCADCNCGGDRA